MTMNARTDLTFDQRACFIAGPDKSGTTLVCSLLEGHPNLAVFPEETNYMRTVLPRLGGKPRSEQLDYLLRKGPSRMLFLPPTESGNSYPGFPKGEYLQAFRQAALAPENRERDLLAIMIEELMKVRNLPLDQVVRWVEKTPDNAYCTRRIEERFPFAKVLVMMRDPRAKIAAHLELMRLSDRPFSIFNNIRNWLQTAALLRGDHPLPFNVHVIRFEDLLREPEKEMRRVCSFLEIPWDPVLLKPTKVGEPWGGNSASLTNFQAIDTRPIDRWRSVLSEREIAWVELHCAPDMKRFGYEPITSGAFFRGWFRRLPEERIASYFKSRWFSLRDLFWKRFSKAAENYP
jgi:hypothetical protein